MSRRSKPLFQRVTAPRNVRPVVPVLKVAATQNFRFICLSPVPWGFTTHWTSKRRTQPCIAHRGKCQHCADLCPRRDRGYLLAAEQNGVVRGFVDLTPEAFEAALQIERATGPLRGRWFQLYRKPETLKGRLILEPWQTPWPVPELLPADVDPEPSLRRIWGLDNVA